MRQKKHITSTDVAKAAGVSQSAVSMILNNYTGSSFTEETRRRVWDACIQLGYHVPSGGAPEELSSNLLLTICPSYENLHYVSLIDAMQKRARELDFFLTAINTRRLFQDEMHVLELARSPRVAGILFLYQPNDLQLLHQLNLIKPLVYVHDKTSDLDIDTIGPNSYKLGTMVGEHLLNLGHRKIAFISTAVSSGQYSRIRRAEGIRKAFADYGLNPEESVRICTPAGTGTSTEYVNEYEIGYLVAKSVIQDNSDVTAIVGLNDVVCYGVIDALTEMKKRIPQDYSVCGFDNLFLSRMPGVSLTTVEHFVAQKGQEAVSVLARKIQSSRSKPVRDANPVSIVQIEYEPKLIVRGSTGMNRRLRNT